MKTNEKNIENLPVTDKNQRKENHHGKETGKPHEQAARLCSHLCPDHISTETGCNLPERNLVDTSDHCGHNHSWHISLPPMEKQPLGIKEKSTVKRSRGRPRSVDYLRIIPIFRDKPDIEKLGRAVIALSEELANQKVKQEDGYENAA